MDGGEDVGSTTRSRWGFWATLGFGIAVAGLFVVTQVAVVLTFALAAVLSSQPQNAGTLGETLSSSGLVLGCATALTGPLCVGLVYIFVRLRGGIGFKEYLGFNEVQRGPLLWWLFAAFLFTLGSDAITQWFGWPLVPDFMVKAYRTAYFLPFLWFALVVVAPLFEEIFFRGFVFEGIRHSHAGPAAAIVLTSLFWTFIHTQYDTVQLASVFTAGLLLGLAKLRTHSLYTPIAMHALVNFIAMVQAHFVLDSGGSAFP
jgi:uncharacterized protein